MCSRLPEGLLCWQRRLGNPAQPWLQVRFASQLQRRRTPSRMSLSPKVGETRKMAPEKAKRKSRNSPFGGMNQTAVEFGRMRNKPSLAQTRRSTRGKEQVEKQERSNDDTFHALKMQRALSSVSYSHRNAIKARIAEIDSFDRFPLLPTVKDSVHTQSLITAEEKVPTPIQRVAVSALLGENSRRRTAKPQEGMEQFLLAAETGSGKTLAYLLPVIDAVKRAEAIESKQEKKEAATVEARREEDPYYVEPPTPTNKPHYTSGRPKAIILVPTSELVNQVTAVLKSFSHTVKFRSAAISASYTPTVIRNRLFSPSGIDILVTTPHLLSSITESDPNVLSRVTHLVVDEADSLMDRSFGPITTGIIDKATSSLKQLIMCSATIPRSLDTHLRSRFPDMRRLVTPNLHAIPRRVQLGVVDVSKDPYHGNKDLACANAIYSIGKSQADSTQEKGSDVFGTKRMLVFVNEREKTEQLAEYLRSKGIDALALHRDIGERRQAEVLAEFTTQPKPQSSDEDVPLKPTRLIAGKRTLPNTKVLVTTDLGSRGIDTVAVRHVILYDVPHSTVDFIHRLGRTGRMGRRGRGIVLVGKGDRRDVVREVREGMFRGQALI